MKTGTESYGDIRDAVRDLCKAFPDEYFRRIEAAQAYPEEFVKALTTSGWLAALIPVQYGGSGLGLAEASVIMEEINRCVMARRRRNSITCRRSPQVNCDCRPWG
mgnify:CR=1 FL=1